MFYFCKSEEKDKCRLHQLYLNWLLTFLVGVNMSASYIMTFPTLHNFLVNPSNESCENPGLGESETLYSVASGITSAGGVIGAFLVIVVAKRLFSYKTLLIVIPLLVATGYVLYGLSTAGWMVIVGRFCVGASGAMAISTAVSYYVSSTTEYNSLREKIGKPKNSRLTRKLSGIFSFVVTITYVPCIGFVVLVGQFPTVDQFRWIAWFNITTSVITALLVAMLFRSDQVRCPCASVSLSRFKTFRVVDRKKGGGLNYISAISITFLVYTGCIIDATLKVMETLTSPILSDYFGFQVSQINYFFFGITFLFPLSTFVLLILEKLRFSSRAIVLIALLVNTSGVFTLGNWQSIGNDPCEKYSLSDHVDSAQCIGDSSCVQLDINVMESCSPIFNSTDVIVDFYYLKRKIDFLSHDSSFECSDDLDCTIFQQDGYTLCIIDTGELILNNETIWFQNTSQYHNKTITIGFHINNEYLNSCDYSELIVSVMDGIEDLMNRRNSEHQQKCESNDLCYWNPDSIITGEYCYECPPLCRNSKKSLHFAQICIALTLITLSIEISRYTLLPLMSKVVSPPLKVATTSLLVLMQSFTRLVTPIWFNNFYVAVGRKILIPTSILLALQIPFYIGYFLLCSRLSGKYLDSIEKQKSSSNTEKPEAGSTSDNSISQANETFNKVFLDSTV